MEEKQELAWIREQVRRQIGDGTETCRLEIDCEAVGRIIIFSRGSLYEKDKYDSIEFIGSVPYGTSQDEISEKIALLILETPT